MVTHYIIFFELQSYCAVVKYTIELQKALFIHHKIFKIRIFNDPESDVVDKCIFVIVVIETKVLSLIVKTSSVNEY